MFGQRLRFQPVADILNHYLSAAPVAHALFRSAEMRLESLTYLVLGGTLARTASLS